MSLQALLRIATWPNVEAISSCPVCKESTDEMFQHFIALHLQKQKMTSRKHLNLEKLKSIFIGPTVPSQDLNSPICVSV